MNNKNHVTNAKAVIAFLVFAIAFVIFWKFIENQKYLFQDPEALRNYVLFAIVGCGFLIGLLYLSSNTKHNEVSKTKTVKSSKKKKK